MRRASKISLLAGLAFVTLTMSDSRAQMPAAQAGEALPAEPAAAKVNALVEGAMKEWDIPGAAVAVVKDGRILFVRGFGLRQAGRSERVDENTSFGIGSVTKSFNATAAAMLVDDGKIGWDRPVIDYVPALHFNDPWLTAHATVRDLAANRTGVDAFLNYYLLSGDHDATVRSARFAPQQTPFRTFQYSNTGFATLGKVVENAAGQSWDAFITGRILKPLGMSHSYSSEYAFVDRENLATCWLCTLPAGRPVGIDALKDPAANVAVPHGLTRSAGGRPVFEPLVLPWRSERSVLSAGMIHASARDMAQYMILHLSDGMFEGKRLMSAAQMQQLHSRQTLIPADHWLQPGRSDSTLSAYGLGWMVGDFKGHRVVRHAGGRVGFGADVWLFPDERLGIVYLQNLDERSSKPAEIASRVAALYLGGAASEADTGVTPRPTNWVQVSDRPAACRAPKERTAASAALAGSYRSDLLGEAKVVVEAGRPALVFEPQSVADIVPGDRGTWTACFRGYEPASFPVRFTYDGEGKATGFVLAEGLFGLSPADPASQAVAYKRVR